MGILSSLFGKKRDVAPSGIQALIRDYVYTREIFKVLGEARTRRELGQAAESLSSYELALEMANRACAIDGKDNYQPLVLRAIINLERGAEDDALIDIQTMLNSGRFDLDEHASMILRGYETKLKARSQSSPDTPVTTIYTCKRCGSLQHFATLPCVACNHIPSDFRSFTESMLLGSSYLRVGQLITVGREIRAGRKAFEVVPNLREQARNLERRLMADQGSKFEELLQDGANYKWIDTAKFLYCENCDNELEIGVADSCIYCNEPIGRSELEQRIISAHRVKAGIEEKCAVSDKNTYDRMVESVVLAWSHMIRNQERPTQAMARRALDAFRQNGVLVWQGGGAIFDCGKAPAIEVYQIQSDLDPQEEPFTQLFGINLQIFLTQLAECR